MLAPDLRGILDRSAAEARSRHHPILTLEHVVYVMACDPASRKLLSACGANVGKLRLDLGRHLDKLPVTGGGDLEQQAAFQAALERAAINAQSSGREQLTTGGFLAALLLEKTSYVVAALARQHVTRLVVTTYLSHGAPHDVPAQGLPKARLLGRWRPAPRPASDRYEVVFHNDDFTTRELVLHLLMAVFARSREDAETLVQEVHERGTGVVGVYLLHEATRLVEQATKLARTAGFPLRMSIWPRG